jgi:predicted RNase H-like HicB family nuclease
MIPMRYKGGTYSLTVEQHERGYFGYFPALPGCRGWGATYDGAVKAAQDALIPYLQMQPQQDDPILKKKARARMSHHDDARRSRERCLQATGV